MMEKNINSVCIIPILFFQTECGQRVFNFPVAHREAGHIFNCLVIADVGKIKQGFAKYSFIKFTLINFLTNGRSSICSAVNISLCMGVKIECKKMLRFFVIILPAAF